MKIGQVIRARFKSIPSQLERQHPTYEQMRNEKVYWHENH